MKHSRVLYFFMLVISIIFISYKGGSIPYLFFYFVLMLPIFSFGYTLIVYMRFRVAQNIDSIRMIKKIPLPYQAVIANEDYFTYTSMRPEYFEDFTKVMMNEERDSYEIAPRSSLKMNGTLYAQFRGTFEAGISSIEIKDFLYLFTIRYPLMSRLKIIVSPRLISMQRLNLVQWMEESDRIRKIKKGTNEVYDPEIRKYTKGDSLKQIHWKSSAKKMELMTRKIIEIEDPSPVLFLDLKETRKSGRLKIAQEDNIVELALAVIRQFLNTETSIFLCSQDEYYREVLIRDEREFDQFYTDSAEIVFKDHIGIEEQILSYYQKHINDKGCLILITGNMDPELMECLSYVVKNDYSVALFYFGTQFDEEENNRVRFLKDKGIMSYCIHPEEDLEKIF